MRRAAGGVRQAAYSVRRAACVTIHNRHDFYLTRKTAERFGEKNPVEVDDV
jgi:hypothetical protein